MATHATIGVYHDLAPRKAGVAHGAANHKATGGVNVDLRVAPYDARAVQNRRHNVLYHIFFDQAHVVDRRIVLRRHHHGGDLNRAVVLVAHGYLRFAVGSQVGKRAVLANCSKSGCHALGQIRRHGHEHVRLV